MHRRKRAFIVHGWGGSPTEGWFPWLKSELETRGFEVEVPVMPHPHAPTIDAWVSHLSKAVGVADRHTFLIGHSIGCQTILRYLERLPSGTAVGGVVLVAPFLTLTGLEGDEEPIARPWLTTPVSDRAVREHTPRLAAIFSDNDAFVPIENRALFEERFGAATYVEHERNHFSGIDGIRELPKALELVLGFAA